MKKAHSYGLLILTLIGILTYSCKKDEIENIQEDLPLQQTEEEQEQIESPDKIIGLGKKLENPFTVSTMKQAYQNLKAKKGSLFSKSSSNDLVIEATDYYARFFTKNR